MSRLSGVSLPPPPLVTAMFSVMEAQGWSLRRIAREADRSNGYVTRKARAGLLRRDMAADERKASELPESVAEALVRIFAMGIVTDEFVSAMRDPEESAALIAALSLLRGVVEPKST